MQGKEAEPKTKANGEFILKKEETQKLRDLLKEIHPQKVKSLDNILRAF